MHTDAFASRGGYLMFILPFVLGTAHGMAASLPEGRGLAERFPGDAGLAQHETVLLFEDFEGVQVADLGKRWSSVENRDGEVMALVADDPLGRPGHQSLQVSARLGHDTGGHLYQRLARPVDRAFFRFYVKFAPDAAYIHHFVHMGGYRPSTPYPQGGAGERPQGDERMTVGIEPYGDHGRFEPPGAWNFYTYWHEMKRSADGRYWGNGLHPIVPARVPRDRWQCVEVMLQLNSKPEVPDGELALWLDGRLTAHLYQGVRRGPWTGMGFHLVEDGGEPFEGFRWRRDPELKINFFWLLHYVTENAARQNRVDPPDGVNRVWFDQIVVATEYIGPMQGG